MRETPVHQRSSWRNEGIGPTPRDLPPLCTECRRIRQAPRALRGLMNVLGSRFSRFAARFCFIDIFATFFTSRSCGVLPDIGSRFPLLAGGEPPTIATFRRK